MPWVYGMIEMAILPRDLDGQHIEGWGVGALGKRSEKQFPQTSCPRRKREYHGQVYE